MLQSKSRWVIQDCDHTLSQVLSKELNISPLVANLLVNRGIVTAESANKFLNKDAANFHDPFLLDSMDIAIARIEKAIENNEKILVYGDYDAGATRS